jgi:acyl carrier protein
MEKLLTIFSDILKVPKEKLSLETGRYDVEEWDSLAQLQLIAGIEEEFNVIIPFEDVHLLEKIGDFVKYIEE